MCSNDKALSTLLGHLYSDKQNSSLDGFMLKNFVYVESKNTRGRIKSAYQALNDKTQLAIHNNERMDPRLHDYVCEVGNYHSCSQPIFPQNFVL